MVRSANTHTEANIVPFAKR